MGNIFVVDSNPELGPGVGGYLYFDYRWSPQLSTQISVIVTTEDGKGISSGDNGIEFLGIPTFDIKYYLISSVNRWDPYLMIGAGIYAISEGTTSNGTVAVGIGANLGIGCDYYFNDKWSAGLTTSFRSIGLIDSISGSNNGTAAFPVSITGNAAYHF
jgi:outer membrane protein W